MPFPAVSVGTHLETMERDITVRSILAYAAGLGAGEAAFVDDARPGGLLALPFQCVSLEWPCLLSLRGALPGLAPDEAVRGVHAVQDSLFHRPMRPGDRLETKGVLTGAVSIRAGVLTTLRLETRDRATGEPVVTSWTQSVYRDVALDGAAAALGDAPSLPVDASAPLPDDAQAVAIHTAREAAHVYTECARIWNPIHTERAAALAAGLPDIILHGTMTWALAGLTVLRHHAGSDVSRLRRIRARFSGMVIPGDTLTVRHAAEGAGAVRFGVWNKAGAAVLSQGVALLEV